MSTRAVYTFKDKFDEVHVYKHSDGYPEGGISWIANARRLAWELPRFEADEFAAAFVAANKKHRGDLRLIGRKEPHEFAADAVYHYVVFMDEKDCLSVEVFAVSWWDGPGEPERLFSGTLEQAIRKFKPGWLDEEVKG